MNNNPTGKNQYTGRGGLGRRLASNSKAQARKGGSSFVIKSRSARSGYSPAMSAKIAKLHASMRK